MKPKRKNKIATVFMVFVAIIVFLLPLTGLVISTIYQIQVQQEVFGFWSMYRHIFGWYDLWNLTLLGYIPAVIWVYS